VVFVRLCLKPLLARSHAFLGSSVFRKSEKLRMHLHSAKLVLQRCALFGVRRLTGLEFQSTNPRSKVTPRACYEFDYRESVSTQLKHYAA
jgi:hypothetical protein